MAVAAHSRRDEARRLASPELRSLFRRRLTELGGIALALLGVATLVALVTYNPLDPSLNTATARHATNLVGLPGAAIADLLLQGFGLAGALPCIALLAWGWRMVSRGELSGLPLRIAAMLAAMPILGAVLSALPGPGSAPLPWPTAAGPGGAGGFAAMRPAADAASRMIGPYGPLAAAALGAVLGISLFVMALGLTAGEWRAAGRTARVSAGGGGRAAGFFLRLTGRICVRASALLDRLNGRETDGDRPRTRRLEPRDPTRPGTGARDEPGWSEKRRDPNEQTARDEPTGFFRPDPRAAVPVRSTKPAAEPRLRGAAPRDPLRDAVSGPVALPPPAALHAATPRPEPAAPIKPKVQAPPRKPAPMPRQEALPLEGTWRFPSLDLLAAAPSRETIGAPTEEALQANARLLETVLGDYGVQGQIVEIRPGPVVTLYELEPAPGIRSARVIGLADDVARSLCVTAVRIATVSGRNVIGIEVPNARRETVYLSELIASEEWSRQQSKLALALGKDISGSPVIADLARMPHLLVAGTTGSGKSVGINAMILSLLFRMSPDQCRLILIDPKMLELSVYEGIPHLMAPVVTEPAKAVSALKWTVREMERRYRAMSQLSVRNIGGYNDRVAEARAKGEVVTRRVQTGFDSETGRPVFEDQPLALEALPFIVVVIDEMADLMMVAGKEIEAAVQRLAQMARAAGIHVVMATQRPSVDVITGTIKANFPTRISFQVISKFDSRTILGEQGSEQLLGQGDMLFMVGGGKITRVHGPYVSDGEVERIVAFLREQGEPAYLDEVTEAPEKGLEPAMSGIAAASDGDKGLFDQAVDIVSREGKATVSFLQRHLQIGYNRAARLIEQMEKEGIVSPANRVGKREVLTRRITDDE
jgi:S-DNA-T family DNA segregation ATPase FtsK/SpoIIIE